MNLRVLSARLAPTDAARRLRLRLLPIAQTALAAVVAYYIAQLIPLDDPRPTFASIAAVICLSATYRQRGRRAVELTAGVVLGLTTADVLLRIIGPGPMRCSRTSAVVRPSTTPAVSSTARLPRCR